MKESALKDIKNISIKISMEAVEHLINNSIDKKKIRKILFKKFGTSQNYIKKY